MLVTRVVHFSFPFLVHYCIPIDTYGSTCELETQILLSGDLDYLNKESLSELQRDIGEVERMLKSLIKSLENKHSNTRTLEPSNPGPLSPN